MYLSDSRETRCSAADVPATGAGVGVEEGAGVGLSPRFASAAMGSKRKGRPAKLRTRLRQQNAPAGAPGVLQHRVAVIDSDNSDASSDSAVNDYVANVYGEGAVNEQMVPLEELFPSLLRVDGRPGLLTSSEGDSLSDDVACDSGDDECWFKMDPFVLPPDSQVKVETAHALSRALGDARSGRGVVPVTTLRGCLAVFEVSSRLGLSASLDSASPPQVLVFRRSSEGGAASRDADVQAELVVGSVLDSVFANRRPSAVCSLDSAEQQARHLVETALGFLQSSPGPDSRVVLQARADSKVVVTQLANILGCVTSASDAGGQDCEVSVFGRSAGVELPRQAVLSIGECLVRRHVWDDVRGIPAAALLASRQTLPACVGSAESRARSVSCQIIQAWASGADGQRRQPLTFHLPTLRWSEIVATSFADSFDIACEVAADGSVRVGLADSSPPRPAQVRVLTAHVDATMRHFAAEGMADAREEGGAKRAAAAAAAAAGRTAAANAFPLPRAGRRHSSVTGKPGKSGAKGNKRMLEDFLATVRELADWLDLAPGPGESLTLQPCRAIVADALCQLGTAIGCNYEKVKVGKAWMCVFQGSSQGPPPRVEVEGKAMHIYESVCGKGKWKKKRSKSERAAAVQSAKAADQERLRQQQLSAAPLNETNRGYQILVGSLGHQVGTGLGANGHGRTTPVLLAFNSGRRGIGS
jgi:G-patch domain